MRDRWPPKSPDKPALYSAYGITRLSLDWERAISALRAIRKSVCVSAGASG
jgi:hypothetical protein